LCAGIVAQAIKDYCYAELGRFWSAKFFLAHDDASWFLETAGIEADPLQVLGTPLKDLKKKVKRGAR
jgi:hypothetical protein